MENIEQTYWGIFKHFFKSKLKYIFGKDKFNIYFKNLKKEELDVFINKDVNLCTFKINVNKDPSNLFDIDLFTFYIYINNGKIYAKIFCNVKSLYVNYVSFYPEYYDKYCERCLKLIKAFNKKFDKKFKWDMFM